MLPLQNSLNVVLYNWLPNNSMRNFNQVIIQKYVTICFPSQINIFSKKRIKSSSIPKPPCLPSIVSNFDFWEILLFKQKTYKKLKWETWLLIHVCRYLCAIHTSRLALQIHMWSEHFVIVISNKHVNSLLFYIAHYLSNNVYRYISVPQMDLRMSPVLFQHGSW